MDLFKLDKDNFDNGQIINGIDTITWVERYNSEGEVTLEATPTHKLLTAIPDGSIISHVDSESIMMIESHNIEESNDGSAVVKFVGRSIDQILMENRVITLSDHEDDAFEDDFSRFLMEFNLPLGSSWDHASTLLIRYLDDFDHNPEEYVPNLTIRNDIAGDESPLQLRVIPKLSYLTIVRDILGSVKAGLKVERPKNTHPDDVQLVIHRGEDKSNDVMFDWNSGDIASARYLWSIKDNKNSAYVSTDLYTLRMFAPGKTGLDLRIMPVDANDWKKDDPTPDDDTIAEIKKILKARGNDQIGKHKTAILIDSKISSDSKYRYNKDYKMGDLVSVTGDYDTQSVMRVVEHALTVDSTGTTAFPTLAFVE